MRGRIIDFYSGLGGASESFVQNGRYQVARIDNNVELKDVQHTYIRNILKLQNTEIEILYGKADLMIFGIPCYEFSLAHNAPQAIASRENRLNTYSPDLSNLEKAIQIIEYCKPKYWIIENVRGAIKHFEPLIGYPSQIIGPFCLWHNLPDLAMLKEQADEIIGHKSKNDKGPGCLLRSNYRAKWPLSLSKSLLKSFETPTLEDFL